MTFQEIFQEEGLYKSESFRKGTAFQIIKSEIDNRLELFLVTYSNVKDLFPDKTPMVVYGELFNKNYTKVFTRQELFK